MSDCNFCKLREIRRKARRRKERVRVVPRTDDEGVDVYVVPGKETAILTGSESPHWVCWFWALGDGCEC